MRKLVSAMLILTIAGCATTITNLREKTFGFGMYRLVAVQNQGLPQRISDESSTEIEVVSGYLSLYSDHTFEMWVDAKVQVSALEPLPFTSTYVGTFVRGDAGATLTWQSGAASKAVFSGRSVSVSRSGVEYLFIR